MTAPTPGREARNFARQEEPAVCPALAVLVWFAVLLVLSTPPARAQETGGAMVRALLVPRTETVLTSEVAARVVRLTADSGDRFQKGETLVVFDGTLYRAQVDKARAELDEARHTLEINRKLEALQSVSALEVAVAQSRMDRAKAELALKTAQAAKCVVRAPFSGRVVERETAPFAYASPGQALLRIIDDARLTLKLLVPSHWAVNLAQGTKFQVRVDETGKTYPARVTALGARIDPASQTLEIRGEIQGNPKELIAGMSGSAVFPSVTPNRSGDRSR